MSEIFHIHFDPSASSGGPISSRHMNRNQARQVIRENIINNCILHRNDEGFNSVILEYITEIEDQLGHKIPFHLASDDNFEDQMGCIGAIYWGRTFIECKLIGAEASPSRTDGILHRSIILLSEKHDLDYHLLWDEDFCKLATNPKTIAQNIRLIDELDNNYNMLGAIVNGYLWAQSLEQQVEVEFKNNPDQAFAFMSERITDKYGGFSKTMETVILDGDLVAMQEVEDS